MYNLYSQKFPVPPKSSATLWRWTKPIIHPAFYSIFYFEFRLTYNLFHSSSNPKKFTYFLQLQAKVI